MTEKDVVFITNPICLLHTQPFPRPHIEAFETPLRVQMADLHLSNQGILTENNRIKASAAKEEAILLTHSPYLLDSIKLMSDLGSGEVGESAYVSPDLLQSALVTVGGAIQAAEIVMKEEVEHAFVLMRPPGHHTSTSNPMGLCYFNNIAIGVNHAISNFKAKKVSILDFDDHHGNGTSEIFYSNPDVQYISLHEYDYENFGLGHYEEIGWGEGKGTNINIPMVDGSPDESYSKVIEGIVIPAIERFSPDIIAVSAGYDAHYADPVGNMSIDSSTYWQFGKIVRNLVKTVGARGSFWILEGGYNPFVIGPSIEASVLGLKGLSRPKMDDQIERIVDEMILDSNDQVIEKVNETLSTYW